MRAALTRKKEVEDQNQRARTVMRKMKVAIFLYQDLQGRQSVSFLWSTAFTVLEMKIWIYWSESNPWIYFYIKLKNLLVLTNLNWSWAGGLVLIVKTGIMLGFSWIQCRVKWSSFCHDLQGHFSGLMVSMLVLSMVDRGFDPRLGQTKDYKIGTCCFSA